MVNFIGTCIGLFLLSIVCAIGMWGCPQYNVYSSRMDGEAQLAHAEYAKKVQVQDAMAKLEAAKSLADAEIERARGISEANKIIGNSLKGHEEYLRWLYIEGLKDNPAEQVIYVPTEAGLPVLEAGRFKQEKKREKK